MKREPCAGDRQSEERVIVFDPVQKQPAAEGGQHRDDWADGWNGCVSFNDHCAVDESSESDLIKLIAFVGFHGLAELAVRRVLQDLRRF